MKALLLLTFLHLSLLVTSTAEPLPILPDPLPDHPRLLATKDDWSRLKQQIKSDAVSARLFKTLHLKADELLSLPPLTREQVGRRLLKTSRIAIERISLLSMVNRITGDDRYARRAIAEMLAIARFTDWNPSHFLDVAEMATGMAIGYDWLYDLLTPAERDEIAQALREKGINPSLTKPEPYFITGTNNWNQVCNAGMSVAAIALAERDLTTAEYILKRSLNGIPRATGSYAPNGAFHEGPMYWTYGTLYHVILTAAVERVSGSTHGLDAFPGFAESAEYIAEATTPTDEFYAYSDSHSARSFPGCLFWFASHFKRPEWITPEIRQLDHYLNFYDQNSSADGDGNADYRVLSLLLLWHRPLPEANASTASLPLHWYGKGDMPLVVHRTAFNDPLALYAAIKGGSPSLSHAHMDEGSFIIQSDGIVWFDDLGMENYSRMEQQGVLLWDGKQNGGRWDVFRLGPESHNILRFNGARQLVSGFARFSHVRLDGKNPLSVLDLTPNYADQVKRAARGFMFVDNKAVLIQDEWTARKHPVDVVSQLITRAEVKIEPGKIRLTEKDKGLTLLLLSPAEITVEAQDVAKIQKPNETKNPGVKRLSLKVRTEAGKDAVLRILAVPDSSGEVKPPDFQTLQAWQ